MALGADGELESCHRLGSEARGSSGKREMGLLRLRVESLRLILLTKLLRLMILRSVNIFTAFLFLIFFNYDFIN